MQLCARGARRGAAGTAGGRAGQVLTPSLITTQRWGQARHPALGERWEQDRYGYGMLTDTGCVGLQGLLEASAACERQRVEHTCAWGRPCLKGPREVLAGAAQHRLLAMR